MSNKTYLFSNAGITQLFENVAAALTLKNANRFRIVAYQNAATASEHATSEIFSLWQQAKLDEIPGFGEQIQEYLNELFTTGKVGHFEAAMRGIAPQTFPLLKIPGVGPKTAVKLVEAGINDIDDLKAKLASGKLNEALSEKLRENLSQALETVTEKESKPKRMLLPYAFAVADKIMAYMRKEKLVEQIEPLGSLRRRVATIGDIDFAVCSNEPEKVITHFVAYPDIEEIILQGDAKASVMLKIGIRVDLMVEPSGHFGALLQHFTGSKMHNIHLRKLAKEKGLKLSEEGITPQDAKHAKFSFDRSLAAKTEEGFYQTLGMQWIPSEMREDAGEIEAALDNTLPTPVALGDIKGDLHLHSSYPIDPSHDLGADSMEKIIDHAQVLGYEYINLTDHNPATSTHTEQQIYSLIEKRTHFVEHLKSTYKLKLLNSLEIDIDPAGGLTVPEKALQLLDLPICGVHSKHAMPRDEITRRVTVAIANPYLKILVHPTNRLLNKRGESDIDWDVIFDVVRKHNKVLEINAYPDRLDLTDSLVREAVSRGIKLVISTDSHAVTHMDNMKFGVDVARRGWATKGDIVNTWNWLDFAKYFSIQYNK